MCASQPCDAAGAAAARPPTLAPSRSPPAAAPPPARAPPMSPLCPRTPRAAPRAGPDPECWLSSRNATLLLDIDETVPITIVIVHELRVLPPAQCVNRGSRWADGLHDTPAPQWQGLHCAGCRMPGRNTFATAGHTEAYWLMFLPTATSMMSSTCRLFTAVTADAHKMA